MVSMPRRVGASRLRSVRRSDHVRIVGDSGNGGAEGSHLLGLQQLMVEAAGLVFEFLAIGDVADEGLHPHAAARFDDLGLRRHLDPDRRAVGASKAEQVVGDRPVAREAIDEHRARALGREAIGIEGAQRGVRRVGWVAEHQPQEGVGGDRDGVAQTEQADVHAFVNGVEQPCERLGACHLGRVGKGHGERLYRESGIGSRNRAKAGLPGVSRAG
jgi:hypothetical protein